jgi:hypothetical protein
MRVAFYLKSFEERLVCPAQEGFVVSEIGPKLADLNRTLLIQDYKRALHVFTGYAHEDLSPPPAASVAF